MNTTRAHRCDCEHELCEKTLKHDAGKCGAIYARPVTALGTKTHLCGACICVARFEPGVDAVVVLDEPVALAATETR